MCAALIFDGGRLPTRGGPPAPLPQASPLGTGRHDDTSVSFDFEHGAAPRGGALAREVAGTAFNVERNGGMSVGLNKPIAVKVDDSSTN